MESFFKEALGSLKTSGTIKPSSKYLIRDCLKDLNLVDAKVIVEFGAGDGCITGEILNNIEDDAKLFSFEINDKFFNHCKSKFQDNKNFFLNQSSALEFDKILKSHNIEKVDYIISSLPLSLLKKEEVKELLSKSANFLEPNGCYVQYQYSLGKYRSLKKVFNDVNLDFTIRNMPPAFIYKCYV